ncbi:MAG: serine/threonine-protein phosphatase, partial [Candidatus Dormibacteraeota bacterium]|nr:serine/threonine-protein phosphatase [Candidatus Dormibacteraeota bacterium]
MTAAQLEVAGSTDRGTVRTENQDCWDTGAFSGGGVYLVLADGMGGHPGGGDAADAAVRAAAGALAGAANGGRDALATAVAAANRAVAQVRERMGGDPGTTLVIASVNPEGAATVANVGDSRGYLVRGETATPLTSDHSWVGEQVRLGALEAGEARRHPRRNIITRAVMGDPVEADVFEEQLQADDVLLLCSDGVWEPLTDAELGAMLGGDGSLASVLGRVCEAAIQAGGTDNVT